MEQKLSENIHRLRSERRLSQEALAAALGVSRQSVSKWETGESVPDLDRLMKLSELFGISLDELVRGGPSSSAATTADREEKAMPANTEDPPPGQTGKPADLPPVEAGQKTEPSRWPQRKALGWMLLCIGAALFLLLLLFLGPGNGLLLSSPFWVSGLICLICRHHPALWCGWAGYVIVYCYLRVCTGIRFWWALCVWIYRPGLEIHAIIAWAELLVLALLLFATVRTFRRSGSKK